MEKNDIKMGALRTKEKVMTGLLFSLLLSVDPFLQRFKDKAGNSLSYAWVMSCWWSRFDLNTERRLKMKEKREQDDTELYETTHCSLEIEMYK